jgi:hypothetical protein
VKRYSRDNIEAMIEVGKDEARRLSGDLAILLGDLAGHLQREHEARVQDAAEIRRLQELVVRLGGGRDGRGLHGDPRDKRLPERVSQGSILDMETHL